jgi:hypothetical protein
MDTCVDFLRCLVFILGWHGSVGCIVLRSGHSRGLALSCGVLSVVGLVLFRVLMLWALRVLQTSGGTIGMVNSHVLGGSCVHY